MSYETPFAGLRVVDLSQGIAGPYCAMLLAQYGADVIKVEPPQGDWVRQFGQIYGDHTAFSIAGNLGKRSIVLDLKDEGDKAFLHDLVATADVFLEGFRPGVIERLGFDYETMRRDNPRLLYLSISGFGQVGPLSEKPAMDPILQAFTGFMHANADKDGEPQRAGPILVDMSTALYAFQAVCPALYARRDMDEGRFFDVSLMHAAANLQVVRMMQTDLLGQQPNAASAPNIAFACKEGYILTIAPSDREFQTFCKLTEMEDLIDDPRFATRLARMQNGHLINERCFAMFKRKTAAEWTALFTEHGLQNEQVLDYPDFLDHPQVAATGLISWLDQPGLDRPVPVPNPPGAPPLKPGGRLAHAPSVGEHSDEIRAEMARLMQGQFRRLNALLISTGHPGRSGAESRDRYRRGVLNDPEHR